MRIPIFKWHFVYTAPDLPLRAGRAGLIVSDEFGGLELKGTEENEMGMSHSITLNKQAVQLKDTVATNGKVIHKVAYYGQIEVTGRHSYALRNHGAQRL